MVVSPSSRSEEYKQALLLFVDQEILCRNEFEHLDPCQIPAVRLCAFPQFVRGLRQGDVKAALASRGAFDQELGGDRGLAGAGTAFEQIQAASCEAAGQYVIEPGDTGPRHFF